VRATAHAVAQEKVDHVGIVALIVGTPLTALLVRSEITGGGWVRWVILLGCVGRWSGLLAYLGSNAHLNAIHHPSTSSSVHNVATSLCFHFALNDCKRDAPYQNSSKHWDSFSYGIALIGLDWVSTPAVSRSVCAWQIGWFLNEENIKSFE